MSPKEKHFEILAEKIIKDLEKRNMAGYYCPTKEDALKKALELIPTGSTVSWGGSESIKEAGLIEAVKSGDYTVYDRAEAKTPEESAEIMKKALFCNYFLGSSNAITYDGKLVNIDGNGNRVSAYIFGPDNVVLITSINKAVPTVEEAISRVRNTASPKNTLRLGLNTPCANNGQCGNCLNGTICCQIVITRYSRVKDRIKVILVGEDLGY